MYVYYGFRIKLDYTYTVEPSITDTFGEQCFDLYTGGLC